MQFHIIGDSFVDYIVFLEDDWPEKGGDSKLSQPLFSAAGGSATNTSTHLQSIIRNDVDNHRIVGITLHSALNPNDENGKKLLDHAAHYGYSFVNYREDTDRSATGHCIVVVSRGERSFMTHGGCIETFSPGALNLSRIIDSPGSGIFVHVAGYFNMPNFWNGSLLLQLQRIRSERDLLCPKQSTLLSLVPQHDASGTWDAGILDLIPLLDFMFMNELEADGIAGATGLGRSTKVSSGGETSVEKWISRFTPCSPRCCFVVTRGSEGAIAFRGGATVAVVGPIVPCELVDPTGAGDAFVAGFLHGISTYMSKGQGEGSNIEDSVIEEALLWGCATGSASVGVRSASLPPDEETIRRLRRELRAMIT